MKKVSSYESTPDLVQKISVGERFAYGLGDFASNLVFQAMTLFITFFYTDIAGIEAATVGTILLFSRVGDAFVDIIMGIVIDRTKSRYGKARPWLLWMALPFWISAVLLFTAPGFSVSGKIIYVIVTYNLTNIIYTCINIPYGALNSLMTQDQFQRSLLNIFRMVMAMIGGIAVANATLPLVKLFGGGTSGWSLAFLLFGGIGAILFIVTFLSTKERVKPVSTITRSNIPVMKGVKALISNKYWAMLVIFAILTFIGMGLMGVNVYFCQYILGNTLLVGPLTMAGIVPIIVGMIVMTPLIKKYGKRNMALIGIVIGIVGSLIMAVKPENTYYIFAGTIMKGFGLAPIIGSIFAMIADTIEYGEWKSGLRTEGLVYSAASFGTKVGAGLGSGLIGWILAMGGYIGAAKTQPPSALFSMKLLFIYIPLLLSFAQIVILLFYKLDKEYPAILQALKNPSRTINE